MIGVGKINDIFCGEGITETYHSTSSVNGMEQTIEISKKDFHGLCFVNLVDFDALWGHRRNTEGYGHEIEKFDKNLGVLLEQLKKDDLLILTADHGNDPTYTDQTIRENMFLLLPIRNRWKTEGNWKARTHLLSLVLLLQKTLMWICRKERSDIPFWKK